MLAPEHLLALAVIGVLFYGGGRSQPAPVLSTGQALRRDGEGCYAGFGGFLGILMVNVVRRVGLLPMGLPSGGDVLVGGVGVVAPPALWEVWLAVRDVNGVVVERADAHGFIFARHRRGFFEKARYVL